MNVMLRRLGGALGVLALLASAAAWSAAPGAPTSVNATPGDSQATVTFVAPPDGGSPITSYTVTSNPDSLTGSGAASGITVSGLTNGTLYTFTVTATNIDGTGPASAPSNAVTPDVAPLPPPPPMVQAGNGSAIVTIVEPTPNGGTPVTAYTVTWNPPDGVDSDAGSPTLQHTITGLTNGVQYTFTVVATNAAGSSAPSPSSHPIRPALPTATITVDSMLDNGVGCTLRKAIENSNGVLAPPHPECATGGLENTIVFAVNGTIPLGANALSVSDRSLTIIGNGPTNTIIDGQNTTRGFEVIGVDVAITLTLRNLTVTRGGPNGGVTGPGGGGLFVDLGATARVEDSVFTNNGGPAGGAILNGGTLEVMRSSFAGNYALHGAAVGGAIANVRAMSVADSTFTGNSSSNGGAIAQLGNTFDDVAADIRNSTFSGNQATQYGGAIASYQGNAPISLVHVTVVGNSAGPAGGGVSNDQGFLSIHGSIVAGNSANVNPDCSHLVVPIESHDDNVFGSAGCNTTGDTGNDFIGNALLGPLANNGGPTTTFKPAAGSPAIARASCAVAFDQRGITRPQGADCDSGAVEVAPPGAPTGVSAVAGNAQATVSFVAPGAGDGSISGYTVTSNPGNFTATGSGSPITVTGLANGTAYTFTVRATNEYGQGPASTPSNSVTPAPPTFLLTVLKAGAGTGLVVNTPGQAIINCGTTCSAQVTANSGVLLMPVADTGSLFTGWIGGGCTGTGGCLVTMDAAKTVTAVFDIDPNPPRLSNISTRAQVLTGNDVMIGGFVIGGSANKTVAIVATGPSLVQHGITNPLANPTLTLVRSDQTVVATNDDWQADPQSAQLGSAGFAPGNALESGLYRTLPPGAYTAIVQGVGGGTGIAVVGVYEVAGPAVPLVNISTRGPVGTGNNVMIGGFVIDGSGPRNVAIVATGPSLAQHGITNPLANPTITLVRSSDQSVVATNDDWQNDPQASQLQAAGFAPGNALESGLYRSLPPGAYTVIVQGVGAGTGVSVIGVYRVN